MGLIARVIDGVRRRAGRPTQAQVSSVSLIWMHFDKWGNVRAIESAAEPTPQAFALIEAEASRRGLVLHYVAVSPRLYDEMGAGHAGVFFANRRRLVVAPDAAVPYPHQVFGVMTYGIDPAVPGEDGTWWWVRQRGDARGELVGCQ